MGPLGIHGGVKPPLAPHSVTALLAPRQPCHQASGLLPSGWHCNLRGRASLGLLGRQPEAVSVRRHQPLSSRCQLLPAMPADPGTVAPAAAAAASVNAGLPDAASAAPGLRAAAAAGPAACLLEPAEPAPPAGADRGLEPALLPPWLLSAAVAAAAAAGGSCAGAEVAACPRRVWRRSGRAGDSARSADPTSPSIGPVPLAERPGPSTCTCNAHGGRWGRRRRRQQCGASRPMDVLQPPEATRFYGAYMAAHLDHPCPVWFSLVPRRRRSYRCLLHDTEYSMRSIGADRKAEQRNNGAR